MNLATLTRYVPQSLAGTMSWTFSSQICSGSVSGSPFQSWVYPSSWAFSMLRPISLGLKWVRGMSVMSNLIVPSLNVLTPFFCLSMPFSRASQVLVLEDSVSRHLRSDGGFSCSQSQAALNSSSRLMPISTGPMLPKLFCLGV